MRRNTGMRIIIMTMSMGGMTKVGVTVTGGW